ncbi:MAG: tetratricopeptide repeat protein [Deltaproteobacteria bacterium]|nr:tetratricopeptide repeat protein [Sandaracinaceae bacterium]MCX7807163.1 tetratricopeptide repeat protein [Deltaproteobacteria bacterium]MDW8245605.1 tetratricopeptide repeat protein [Sandaracinaceae bacterium]
MDDRSKELLRLGREHYERGEYDKAEPLLRALIESNHRFADVYNMLGLIYHLSGRLDEARAMFEEALAINPKYTDAALNLAVTYNALGFYEDSSRLYKEALRQSTSSADGIDPYIKGKIANLHAELAQAYEEVNLIEHAKEELLKALALCPSFVDLRVRLARIHRQLGEIDKAIEELQKAVELRSEYAPAWLGLGLAFLAQGKKEEARRAWKQAILIDPSNRLAQAYLRIVEKEEA